MHFRLHVYVCEIKPTKATGPTGPTFGPQRCVLAKINRHIYLLAILERAPLK